VQFDFVTEPTGALEKPDVSFAAQGAFQREGFAAAKTFIHLREQQARSANRTGTGFQR
jgi:hypothetical protein